MRKLVLAITAIIGMTSVAHADGYWPRHHHGHHGGGCYNCNVYRGGGGDPGLALFGGLVGGMIIGGMIANSNQGYYQPVCQTVFMGRVFDGWRWVDRYERVCQ